MIHSVIMIFNNKKKKLLEIEIIFIKLIKIISIYIKNKYKIVYLFVILSN